MESPWTISRFPHGISMGYNTERYSVRSPVTLSDIGDIYRSFYWSRWSDLFDMCVCVSVRVRTITFEQNDL